MTPCSRKRLLLAIYVDLLLFTTVSQLASWLVAQRAFSPSLPVAAFAFAAIELGILRVGGSPGTWSLGIVRHEGVRAVLPAWPRRERWWTVLVGVLALLSGAKEATRWTVGLPPPPFMGLTLSWDQAAAVITTSGIVSILAGVGVLRTHARAALLGLAINLVTTTSWVASSAQIPAWVEARTRAQRAQQGLPQREGDIERLTWMLRGGVLFGGVVGGVWLLVAWRRFRRLDHEEAAEGAALG
ncbi:MAG: hypothetical protein ABW252_06790 [Polyangiales bacterium]